MESVAGLFRNYRDAEQAVLALQEAGFDPENISLLARNNAIEENLPGETTVGDVAEGAGVGAATGGFAGGLLGVLAGLGAIVIPGIGPAVAAGSLAATLGLLTGGASLGAAVGGILGAMTKLSVPEEEAQVYIEGVRRGYLLVIAQAETDRLAKARAILENAHAEDIDALRRSWKEAGWSAVDDGSSRPA
jgi:hypothetical protein